MSAATGKHRKERGFVIKMRNFREPNILRALECEVTVLGSSSSCDRSCDEWNLITLYSSDRAS